MHFNCIRGIPSVRHPVLRLLCMWSACARWIHFPAWRNMAVLPAAAQNALLAIQLRRFDRGGSAQGEREERGLCRIYKIFAFRFRRRRNRVESDRLFALAISKLESFEFLKRVVMSSLLAERGCRSTHVGVGIYLFPNAPPLLSHLAWSNDHVVRDELFYAAGILLSENGARR